MEIDKIKQVAKEKYSEDALTLIMKMLSMGISVEQALLIIKKC